MTMLSNEYWLPREFREKTHDRFVVCYLALALDCAVPILDAYHHRCAPLRIQNYPRSVLYDRISRFMQWQLTGRTNWRPQTGGWTHTNNRGIDFGPAMENTDHAVWCRQVGHPKFEPGNDINWAWQALTLSDTLIIRRTAFEEPRREPLYAHTVALQFETLLKELIISCEQ